MPRDIRQAEYTRLLQFRVGLRKFIHWSEGEAKAAGITPAQHQLLLAIKGHDDDRGPSIGQVANYLFLKHHSVVGLADRAEEAGLVSRISDPADNRVVRLRVTSKGERILDKLTVSALDELGRLGGQLDRLWRGIDTPLPYTTLGLRSSPAQTTAKKSTTRKAPAKKRGTKKAAARRR